MIHEVITEKPKEVVPSITGDDIRNFDGLPPLKKEDTKQYTFVPDYGQWHVKTDRIRALTDLYIAINSQEDEHKQLELEVIKQLNLLIQ